MHRVVSERFPLKWTNWAHNSPGLYGTQTPSKGFNLTSSKGISRNGGSMQRAWESNFQVNKREVKMVTHTHALKPCRLFQSALQNSFTTRSVRNRLMASLKRLMAFRIHTFVRDTAKNGTGKPTRSQAHWNDRVVSKFCMASKLGCKSSGESGVPNRACFSCIHVPNPD